MYKIRKKWTKISNFWTEFWKKKKVPTPILQWNFKNKINRSLSTYQLINPSPHSGLHVNSLFTVHRRQNSIKYKSTENTNNNQQIKTLSNQPPPHKPTLPTAKGDFKAQNPHSKPHKSHSKFYKKLPNP